MLLLCDLFDEQMEKLRSLNCPWAILSSLQLQKERVLSSMTKVNVQEGNVAFLPVIPRSYLGVYGLVQLVVFAGSVGYTHIELAEISDVVRSPNRPYFIFNVEDGYVFLGKSSKEAGILIEESARSGLTIAEIISVAIHTDVLSRHNIDAVGSRCGTNCVPSLYLHENAPRLIQNFMSLKFENSGAASCGSRGFVMKLAQ